VSYTLSLQSLLEEISPTWVNVSLRMKDDPETDKAFGWVLEMWVMFDRILSILLMNLDLEWLVYIQCCSHIFVDLRYAYAVASALHGVRHILHEDFMLQVPVVYGNASCISLFLKVAHSELPISMYVSATMGFGSWEEIYYPLHLWMRLQYEGKRRDLSLSLSLSYL